MNGEGLTDEEVNLFIEDGFVHLRDVVPADVVAAGREVMWSDLGRSPADASPWEEPVARFIPSVDQPFNEAFENPRLFTAFDQLVGDGRWIGRPHPRVIGGSLRSET